MNNIVTDRMIVTDQMVEQFKRGFHGSTLNSDQVRRGLAAVFLFRSLFDGTAPMADGGDTQMTAAEEVLAYLLVEKIGVPDDVPYSPDRAQEIIEAALTAASASAAEPVAWQQRLSVMNEAVVAVEQKIEEARSFGVEQRELTAMGWCLDAVRDLAANWPKSPGRRA